MFRGDDPDYRHNVDDDRMISSMISGKRLPEDRSEALILICNEMLDSRLEIGLS